MKPSALLLLAFAALALPASARTDGAAVYRPGLTQARIPLGSPLGFRRPHLGVPALASNLLENAEASWLDRTLDVFKGGSDTNEAGKTVYDNNAVNPISGKTWPWTMERKHGVFAYEGEIFVEQGTNYFFYARHGDGGAIVVDGVTVSWQGLVSAYNLAPNIRRFWTAPKTGWVPFNVWLWAFDNRTGPQWSQWGAQYNVAGFSLNGLSGPDTDSGIRTYSYNIEPKENSTWRTNVWKRFVDPGNGTFLRTVTGEKFTSVGESAAVEGGGRSFDLSFENVPTNAQLVAFTGPADGFHDAGDWRDASAVLAEVLPGTSTTKVIVPLASDATVLRFRLAHFDAASTNGLDVFEEWTEMTPVTAAPVLLLDAVSPGWTNVVVAGSLESFGIGGSTATVTVEVFSEDDETFENPVSSRILATTSVLGTFEAELFGLETNANYFVRAKAANDGQTVGFSAPVAFSTRDPAQPVASVAVPVAGFRFATLQATVSDWGGGSWGAEAWIDVSEDAGFPAGETQTLALGVLSGAVPAAVSATAADLRSDTDHFARVRATNSWGVSFVSGTVRFRTADHPIDFPEEPTAISEKGRVSATLSPTFVTPGTTYDVELYAEGPGYSGVWQEWKNQTGYGPFEWSRQTTPGVDVLIRYTVRWRYPETDAKGTNVLETTTAAKIADHVIAGLPGIDPLNGGSYLRPGDTVAITPTPGARIDWHTNDVFSVTETNGHFIVTALEPGAALFYETDLATGKTNNIVAAGIVLPAEAPPGGIYVHRALKEWKWNDPSEWEVVEPGSGDWPNGPGSMVYVVSEALGVEDGPRFIEITEPVTVGWIAVGQLGWIHHMGDDKSHWPWIFSDNFLAGGSLRFDSGDGSASWIRLLGHSYIVSRVLFEVPVDMANDLEIDELDRIQDTTHWRSGRYRGLWFKEPVDVGPHEFRTIRAHPHPYRYGSIKSQNAGGVEAPGWFSFRNDVRGSGTIRLEAATQTGLTGDDGIHTASFTGTWIAANGDMDPKLNSGYGGAGLNLYGLGLGNAKELIIRGSWHRAEKTWPRGALVRTGHATSRSDANETSDKATTNDWQNALPPRVVLDGGVLQTHPQGEMTGTVKTIATTTGIRRNLFRIEELVVPAGPMGRFESKVNNSANWANVLTEITNLVLDAGAVVSFEYDSSTANNANDLFLVNKPDAAWTSDETPELQFLPFFFANNQRDGLGGNTIEGMTETPVDNLKLAFRDRDTGRVFVTNNTTDSLAGYKRWATGAELEGGDKYHSMQLAQNVTNSFAPGATVQNLAGYLDMRKGAVLGRPGTDAGVTLDFGDQPARIYVGNWGETATIGCRLRGSAGLVKGGNGTVALGASAEGVAGGVRVAGGTLALGAPGVGGTNCVGRVAGDVVVEAGSRLVVRDKQTFAPGVRLFLNDRDWIPSYAHVRMESDASVAKLFVCGEAMPNGYYGSSAAADSHPTADVIVDDVHFEGPGLLWAGVRPTMLIFK